MSCCAACARGSSGQMQACEGGQCNARTVVETVAKTMAPKRPTGRLWFERESPFAPRRRADLVIVPPIVETPAPTQGMPARRGRQLDDAGGDMFVQERPTGDLPEGVTAAQWEGMTPAERTAYVNRVAQTDAQRQALIAESVRQGLTGLSAIILAIYAGEQARMRSDADRATARQAAHDVIELAQIQAQRDIEIARARGPGLGTDTSGLSTTPHPTTGAEWDALTPAQQQAAGPRPPGLSTKAKWGIGIGVGAVVLVGGGLAVRAALK